MINLLNQNDVCPIEASSEKSGVRHWGIDFANWELIKIVTMGARAVQITNEMLRLKWRK